MFLKEQLRLLKNCIKNLNSSQTETQIDLAIIGLGILAKKHYSIK